MGVIAYSQEITSVIARSRMFKALILDSHNILPIIVPEGIKSVEFIEGDGGAGSIKQTTFCEVVPFKYTKHKINALDVENYCCKYTLIETDMKFEKIDFIVYEVKFVETNNGCLCKMTTKYHVKEGADLEVDDFLRGRDILMGLFKPIEAYLVEHPDLSA